MPTTVNGIGTHYYGKKNVLTRTAACAACHRVGALESYDTRLWFVIVFIPVIPLGRKRIMDECPVCRRHFVASADVYEQARQLQTSGSLEQYHREPSPETAQEVHRQHLMFREHDQAAAFRQEALARFPNHASLRARLAQQLREVCSYQESAQLFQEAFDLDPSDPDARAGVALQKMAAGELDQARTLISFLEEPGAGQHYNLGPLDLLAGYYQRGGHHEQALQLAEVLLREWPRAANLYTFRAFVRKSEKALGRRESILPPQPFSLLGLFRAKDSPYAPGVRGAAITATLVLLLAAGLALNNEYIRRHRTLHVVNACGVPAQVQVDDEPLVTIERRGAITLAEGPHTIKVTGPVTETHNIELESGYFARWFSSPAWVLNPGGEAVLLEVQVVYSKTPMNGTSRPIIGEVFYARPHCDYIFEKAPAQMSVSNTSSVVTKTELEWVRDQDPGVFQSIVQTDHARALDFAERRLRRQPLQPALFRAYLAGVTDADLPRVQEFLKSGLEARPVSVTWHRAYQSLAERDTPEAELIAQYDRYLAADPSSAALLYLRGRLEPDPTKQAAYYRRALDADPKQAWAWVGRAAQEAAAGRWPECLAAAAKAKELPLDDPDLLDSLVHQGRLATGDAAALAKEYQDQLGRGMSSVRLLSLVEALVVAGKADEIDAALAAWENLLPPEYRDKIMPQVRAYALYQQGKAPECEALCAAAPALQHAPIHAFALMSLGKARQAADDAQFARVWDDPWSALALSLALSLDGRADDAARWREHARTKFQPHRLGEVLGATEPPSLDAIARLNPRASDRALLLAALAERFPARREEYHGLAAKLNVIRTPHYLVVRRALDLKPAAPR